MRTLQVDSPKGSTTVHSPSLDQRTMHRRATPSPEKRHRTQPCLHLLKLPCATNGEQDAKQAPNDLLACFQTLEAMELVVRELVAAHHSCRLDLQAWNAWIARNRRPSPRLRCWCQQQQHCLAILTQHFSDWQTSLQGRALQSSD